MPTVQSSYGNMSAARVGQIAEWNDAQVLISRTVETGALAPGAGALQGAADNGAKPIDNSGKAFRGIAVRTQSMDAAGSPVDSFAVGGEARIMEKGVVWVTAGATVAAGDSVYYTTAGVWTNTSNSAANPQVPNAIWDSSATSGNLAKIRLR